MTTPTKDKPVTAKTSPAPTSPTSPSTRRVSFGAGNDGSGGPIYKVIIPFLFCVYFVGIAEEEN
jgi:hypothetical protein